MIKTSVNFAIKSRKGKRKVNQDNLVATWNRNGDFIAICCDGVGSVKGSEVASSVICQVFALAFEKTDVIEKPIIWAKKTLEIALTKLEYVSKGNFLPGIATTMAMLMVVGNVWYAFNIGDTRIYGFKQKEMKQLTTDHNYYNYLVKKHATQEVIDVNKSKWASLTNYIEAGKPAKAVFSYVSGDTKEYNYFLLCTDGLYEFIPTDKLIKRVNSKWMPLVLRASLLNSYAFNHESTDNISCLLVSCKQHGKQ